MAKQLLANTFATFIQMISLSLWSSSYYKKEKKKINKTQFVGIISFSTVKLIQLSVFLAYHSNGLSEQSKI